MFRVVSYLAGSGNVLWPHQFNVIPREQRDSSVSECVSLASAAAAPEVSIKVE